MSLLRQLCAGFALVISANINAQLIVSTIGNEKLNCIAVNDPTASANASGWVVDATTLFSSNCQSLGSGTFDDQNVFVITPNPVRNGTVIISSPVTATWSLFSSHGQLLQEEQEINIGENSISLKGLSSNLYFIRVQSSSYSSVKKLIIN